MTTAADAPVAVMRNATSTATRTRNGARNRVSKEIRLGWVTAPGQAPQPLLPGIDGGGKLSRSIKLPVTRSGHVRSSNEPIQDVVGSRGPVRNRRTGGRCEAGCQQRVDRH